MEFLARLQLLNLKDLMSALMKVAGLDLYIWLYVYQCVSIAIVSVLYWNTCHLFKKCSVCEKSFGICRRNIALLRNARKRNLSIFFRLMFANRIATFQRCNFAFYNKINKTKTSKTKFILLNYQISPVFFTLLLN